MSQFTVEALDQIIGKEFQVQDHGFVRVIKYSGNDTCIANTARVSYGQGTRQVSADRALLRYLMSNGHTSPFEHVSITLHLRMPLFVARQWLRHRTASVNEYSARYSEVPDRAYIPDLNVICPQSKSNKQAREDTEPLPASSAERVQAQMREITAAAYKVYTDLLQGEGVARELARTILTQNYYTEFFWTMDLHNLLKFLKLRTDRAHAQRETCDFADKVAEIVQLWVPISYQAYLDYVKNAVTLSAQQLEVVRRLIQRDPDVSFDSSGLSRREWKSLMATLNLEPSADSTSPM